VIHRLELSNCFTTFLGRSRTKRSQDDDGWLRRRHETALSRDIVRYVKDERGTSHRGGRKDDRRLFKPSQWQPTSLATTLISTRRAIETGTPTLYRYSRATYDSQRPGFSRAPAVRFIPLALLVSW